MDGYNPYPWNQFYNQNAMVYPPQHEDFGYDNRRNFDYHYQIPQVPSYYQDWSHASPSNDFQPQQEFDPSISSSHDERPSTEEMLTLIYKDLKKRNAKLDEFNQFMELSNGKIKNIEFQISQLSIIVEKLQEEEESEEGEEEEGPRDEKNEDENFIIEEDQEECPSMDMSNNEQENQEASNDILKSEMSISQPLNSSICTFFDNDVSIDFILPLDSFDHKKEVEENLGILKKNGREWKEMMRGCVEEKLCVDGMGDRCTLHESLFPFEAQRLRYNRKED
ncbi:hypothetical protein ACS0TY_031242 [Phlomoides rotata]